MNLLLTWTASACRDRFYGVSGGLSIQRVEEIFIFKVNSTDQFDRFMDKIAGFFTSFWIRTVKS